MKTRRQRVWLPAIAIAGSVALYGCGGGSSPDTTPYDQAAVDQAAAKAAEEARAATAARAAAIAAAEAAAADARKAAMDAAAAEMAAEEAATMAANNAMATGFDVGAATTASGAAADASSEAAAALTAAEAASARAAAVDHADPAVTAAKAAAAADAAAARMSADSAAASEMAAADSVIVAMQLQAQAEADATQSMTDADNARMAGSYAQAAAIAAGNALSLREMAQAVYEDVVNGLQEPDDETLDKLQEYRDMAFDNKDEAEAARDNAKAIPSEDNSAVASAVDDAENAFEEASLHARMTAGATQAVWAHYAGDVTAGYYQDVLDADAAINRLKSSVSWIVTADQGDVAAARANAGAAQELAPHLANDAFTLPADGSHIFTDVYTERYFQMRAHLQAGAELKATVEADLGEAADDYDSAVPTFENGKMNVAGAMVESDADLATGNIVRTGENGENTGSFMVNQQTLASADTIALMNNRLDYIADERIVTTAGYNDDLTQYTTEVIQYDKWAVGKSYEYITFGSWAVRSAGLLVSNLNAQHDSPGSRGGAGFNPDRIAGLTGGTFAFVDQEDAWDPSSAPEPAAEARYNGAHTTIMNTGTDGRTWGGPATITVNFDDNRVNAVFRDREPTPDSTTGVYPIYALFSVTNLVLEGAGITMDENSMFAVDGTAEGKFQQPFDTATTTPVLTAASGGIYGENAEEIVATIEVTNGSLSVYSAFGGRHQSFQQ